LIRTWIVLRNFSSYSLETISFRGINIFFNFISRIDWSETIWSCLICPFLELTRSFRLNTLFDLMMTVEWIMMLMMLWWMMMGLMILMININFAFQTVHIRFLCSMAFTSTITSGSVSDLGFNDVSYFFDFWNILINYLLSGRGFLFNNFFLYYLSFSLFCNQSLKFKYSLFQSYSFRIIDLYLLSLKVFMNFI